MSAIIGDENKTRELKTNDLKVIIIATSEKILR
jgi:hypothetical protein